MPPKSLARAAVQLQRHAGAAAALLVLFAHATAVLQAQSFLDPGFESYAVESGGFLQPAGGPWLFANDAGVVEPSSPNSSTGPLHTWSATFAPVEGQQYACTYASVDTLRQLLNFSAPGDYRLSVFAAAPNGTVAIPTVGTFTLGDGEFTFTLGAAAIGSLHTVRAGSGWSQFTVDITIVTPGNYQLGVRNTAAAPYFINYDAFAIQPVPEPSALALGVLGVAGLVVGSCRRRR